jgi:hypothetical protein
MSYLIKRVGLFIYGILSIIESVVNTLLYISHIDLCRKPFDMAMPFYFWYVNKFLKGTYIANLKDKHGQDI